MYGHFTFFFKLLFQRHRLDPKNWDEKKKKKCAQNNVNMCRLVTEKEKKKEKGTAEENKEKKWAKTKKSKTMWMCID